MHIGQNISFNDIQQLVCRPAKNRNLRIRNMAYKLCKEQKGTKHSHNGRLFFHKNENIFAQHPLHVKHLIQAGYQERERTHMIFIAISLLPQSKRKSLSADGYTVTKQIIK